MFCHCGRPAKTTNGTCGQCWSPPQIVGTVPKLSETPAECRLRDVIESPTTLGTVTDKELAAIDMGREALALLRRHMEWNDGVRVDAIGDNSKIEALLSSARALLARANEVQP